MKKLTIFFTFIIVVNSFAQDKVDIGTPTNGGFNTEADIQGTIQNSVNEVTGKVAFSASLGSIGTGSVAYAVSLTYNGQVAFKNGQEINKYNPTSTVGVGWSMGTPKIIVDNKQTATRDDDTFYLLDGGTNSKLICTSRGNTTNGSVWEFQAEKYVPWKIEFYYHNTHDDYWKITKDNGLIFTYGNPDVYSGIPSAGNAREYALRIYNWIGNSIYNGTNGVKHTIAWNLYKIEDQWGNNIKFEYDVETQYANNKQTEASYLKKITSSKGASIQLTYGAKDDYEYYEPHTEAAEPDAYQERYEKQYLQSVSIYNNSSQLVSTNTLGYTIEGSGVSKKRYLANITQTAYNNGQNESLPAQAFEYYHTGDFKGGIKKITYPTGGSVTYNYKNKFLFNNSANQYEGTAFSQPSGYQYHSSYVNDNYGLYVYRTVNKISGDKYRLKIFRVWWNGQKWEWEEFTFPHLVPDSGYADTSLDGFDSVLGNNFYGFIYDEGTTTDVYLWHLNKDGHTWSDYISSNKTINSTPYFMSGNDFVALGSRDNGNIYTYVWNGTSWNNSTINQGNGEYYMAARNNFIIALDDDGNDDMITGADYHDNYYFHYLDAEKNWQTKSWSAVADPYISDVVITDDNDGSATFYPDNSIAGFVVKNNPELFLRWDTNYNLTSVDDVLGSYNDLSPMTSVGSGMFTIYNHWYKYPIKSARFNGLGWSVFSPPSSSSYYSKLSFGYDLTLFQNHDDYTGTAYYKYFPDFNSWIIYPINNYSDFHKISATNSEFTIAGNKIYDKSEISLTSANIFSEIGTLQYDNKFTYTDGLSHTFVRQENSSNVIQSAYFYKNKESGSVENISLGLKEELTSVARLGGYTPFMSPKNIWLKQNTGNSTFSRYFYRIIDDKINNTIYDVVVNHIDINDDNGGLRKVQYTYNNPKCSPDNSSTFYGEVIIENKGTGTGTGNMGKIVKLFNDGAKDLTMVGLPLEVLTIDNQNKLVKKNTTTWTKYTNTVRNSSFRTIDQSYYIRPTQQKEALYFDNSPDIITETNNSYNALGLKTRTATKDSKGSTVSQSITYAYEAYSFVEDKNMLSFPFRATSYAPTVVNVEESKWVEDNGKVYINENWSGPTLNNLRLNNQISKVESTTGNVLENNNGKGIYNSVLFAHDNLYEVAIISNAKYDDVVNALDVSYSALQNLTTANLKTQLLKLYDKLPDAGIKLTFYDDNGRVISTINERQEEAFIYYDTLGREDYITDADGNVLEKKNYYFNN